MLEPGSVHVREAIQRGTDPDSGATLKQITSGVAIHTQIYGEVPYSDPDSRYVIFTKAKDTHGPIEVWRADLQTDYLTPVCDSVPSIRGMAVSPDQKHFYCVRGHDEDRFEIVRTDIASLEQTGCAFNGPPFVRALGSMSPDGRTYITATQLGLNRYGIVRCNLQAVEREVIHEGPEICNAHPQLEPGRGERILVQHNRGCEFDDEGRTIRLTGEMGATLYLIDIDGGNCQELPVGKPFTHRCQGHQCWIGVTGEILLTVAGSREESIEEGNLLALRPGEDAPRVIAKGHFFWHPNASRDGRFFVSDVSGTGEIVVGSLHTGRNRVLCQSGSSCGRPQYTHPHPYFTPDCRWVIFNSDRTGIPQVHAARIPEGLLEGLDSRR